MIKQSLMTRKQLLEHDFSVTCWDLSILLDIQYGVRLNLDCDKRMTIERVIAKIHVTPNLNSKVANDEIDFIINIFWKEFGHFQNNLESMVCTQASFFSQMH